MFGGIVIETGPSCSCFEAGDLVAIALDKEAVGMDRTITPCNKNSEAYKRHYELYLELYPKLIPLLRRC